MSQTTKSIDQDSELKQLVKNVYNNGTPYVYKNIKFLFLSNQLLPFLSITPTNATISTIF